MANRFDDKVASVSKALTVLEELSMEPNGLGLLELSNRVGMHKTTVYRLLTSLLEKDFVEQDEISGRYSMGLRILSLANAFYEKIDIRVVLRKYITSFLEEQDGFLLASKKMDQGCAVMDCLERGVMAPVRVGDRIAKESVILKVFYANTVVWQQGKNPVLVDMNLRQAQEYRQELKNIALQGYAQSSRDLGALPCVAAPVFDYSKNLVCVISVHSLELENQKIQAAIILKLMNAVNQISGQLGFVSYL